jgi:YegS/Rv2252/BmrU family lipid kinase
VHTPSALELSTLAIINPAAGKRAANRIWRRIVTTVEPARSWECATSERPDHARQLTEAAVRRGFERVVAIGGDGTVCEVANGLAGSQTTLGIIPAGTGNDVSDNLAIPRDPVAAARLAATGQPRAIDLCEIQTRQRTAYFVNIAGFGFDAEAAWRVNRLPKLMGGTLPYVAGVLQTLWRYRSPRMRISIDDTLVDRRVFLVAVGNCPSYAGGMRILPRAMPNDGLLDVCVVKDLKRIEVLRIVPKLYSGGHVAHPAVEMFRCRSVSADADARVLCQADGELVGELPVRFGVLPGALRCVTGPLPASAP